MAELLVETSGLQMSFGGLAALDGIDFKLHHGELRCLIGPNGAGKSTLFKCLTGEHRPTGGDIWLGGNNITGWLPHQIARLGVGVKTQVPSVMDGLTVAENLWVVAYRVQPTASGSRRLVDRALETHGLGEIAHKALGTLAHGQRQRVEIACVLTSRPRLCLLDEPAAGMDEAEVEWLAGTLEEMAGSSTVVVVEHDMQFIRQIARQVTVFHQGKVLVEGEASEVMADSRVREIYLGEA